MDENDIVASVGSKGDSYDNAMAESFNSLFKWELIYPRGPWSGLDDVEFATLGYIDWFNHRRLHGKITADNRYTTPAEFEAAYYRQMEPAFEAVYSISRAVMKPGAVHTGQNGAADWLPRQGVVATTSLIFSNGVIQPSVSRGRRLS